MWRIQSLGLVFGFIIAVLSCLETSHWHDDVQNLLLHFIIEKVMSESHLLLKCFVHNQKFNAVSETRFGKRTSWMV